MINFATIYIDSTIVSFLNRKKEKSKKTNSANEISDPILLEQYTAIADYKKQKNTECSLTAGQIVEVIDRNENG